MQETVCSAMICDTFFSSIFNDDLGHQPYPKEFSFVSRKFQQRKKIFQRSSPHTPARLPSSFVVLCKPKDDLCGLSERINEFIGSRESCYAHKRSNDDDRERRKIFERTEKSKQNLENKLWNSLSRSCSLRHTSAFWDFINCFWRILKLAWTQPSSSRARVWREGKRFQRNRETRRRISVGCWREVRMPPLNS